MLTSRLAGSLMSRFYLHLIMATVSIILTVYNRDRYLSAAIESVLQQTYADFELLIWDDGSTDLSPQIARYHALQDPRVRVKIAQHQGVAPSLKAAIAATTGEYIGWVDSDDLLGLTALEQTVAVLNAHSSIGMVYTNYRIIDEQGHDRGLGERCHIPYSPDKLLVDFMTFHFRLMRRSVYEQVGGVDPSYQWAEDYDLCLKLSEVTQIYHLPEPLYFYRRHNHNLTNNQYETIRWAQVAIEQAIVRRGLDQKYRLNVRLTGQFTLLPYSTAVSRDSTEPLVSVIIPTHNRLTLLDRALRSVLGQTYSHYEIIVVDDGSTDGTTAWLRTHHPQIRLITLSGNGGAAAARNQGVENAQGQFLAFLDSDDEWHPHYLQRQLDTLAQHPEAILVYCNYVYSFAAHHPDTRVPLKASHADSVVAMLQACFIHTLSQVVLPTARFRQIDGFNPQLRSCHDWDFYLRLFKLGAPVHCSDFLVRKYWLPNSLVTQAQGQAWLENGSRVLDLFYQRPENSGYASLRPIAIQNLQANIAQTQHWFAQGFQQAATRITP
jgi:glycosyltransferase involved in cell wall biosynthesis